MFIADTLSRVYILKVNSKYDDDGDIKEINRRLLELRSVMKEDKSMPQLQQLILEQ